MGEIQSYKDLEVWKEAKLLTLMVYRITSEFPKEEAYGLISQLRRAAVSVPSNIAEGCGRGTDKGTVNFIYNARGSLFEVETQLIIASELNYATPEILKRAFEQIEKTRKLLHGFIRYYESKATHNSPVIPINLPPLQIPFLLHKRS
jgi:four helix bundle protein